VTTTVTATVTFATIIMTFVVTIVIVAAMTFAATVTFAATTVTTVTMAAATNNLGGVSSSEFGEEAFCAGSIQVRNLDESHSQTIPVMTSLHVRTQQGMLRSRLRTASCLPLRPILLDRKLIDNPFN
jgi:hypothetical protein